MLITRLPVLSRLVGERVRLFSNTFSAFYVSALLFGYTKADWFECQLMSGPCLCLYCLDAHNNGSKQNTMHCTARSKAFMLFQELSELRVNKLLPFS